MGGGGGLLVHNQVEGGEPVPALTAAITRREQWDKTHILITGFYASAWRSVTRMPSAWPGPSEASP